MMEEMGEVDIANTPLALKSIQSHDSTDSLDEGPPDPRIQIELEKLNASMDLINKLEGELDEARLMFRQTLTESTQRIDNLTKRLGKCIDQSRPYYDARIHAKQDLAEAQKSALRYERAVSQHAAAREMVQLAEEGLLTRGCIFDSTWQEMLNHATTKVNDAEIEKGESSAEHKEKSQKYHDSEMRVKILQKELKRAIAKSSLNARRSLLQISHLVRMQELQLLPYFELKAAVNRRLEEQKRHVREVEESVSTAKKAYSEALSNLETISNQIHQSRQGKLDLGVRGSGVGAESPCPPVYSETKPFSADAATTSNMSDTRYGQMAPPYSTSNRIPGSVSEILLKKGPELNPGDTQEVTDSRTTESTSGHPFLSDFKLGPMLPVERKRSSHHLNVDDNESIISDSESLASIEMLGEDAIANLMLEDDVVEAIRSHLDPQTLSSGKGAASLNFIPGLVGEGEHSTALSPDFVSDSVKQSQKQEDANLIKKSLKQKVSFEVGETDEGKESSVVAADDPRAKVGVESDPILASLNSSVCAGIENKHVSQSIASNSVSEVPKLSHIPDESPNLQSSTLVNSKSNNAISTSESQDINKESIKKPSGESCTVPTESDNSLPSSSKSVENIAALSKSVFSDQISQKLPDASQQVSSSDSSSPSEETSPRYIPLVE